VSERKTVKIVETYRFVDEELEYVIVRLLMFFLIMIEKENECIDIFIIDFFSLLGLKKRSPLKKHKNKQKRCGKCYSSTLTNCIQSSERRRRRRRMRRR
jgi:hypothetical protein